MSFMEDVVKWHHGVPSDDEYDAGDRGIGARRARARGGGAHERAGALDVLAAAASDGREARPHDGPARISKSSPTRCWRWRKTTATFSP